VLWQYVRVLQNAVATGALPSSLRLLIYTGDSESAAAILARAEERFGIALDPSRVEFVRLRLRWLATAEAWPRFTLLGQSLGSVLLAAEALLRRPCVLFVDSTGAAFSFPLARRVFGAAVHSYTHYPTVSADMLRVVDERRAAHNNSGAISRSPLLAWAKGRYYRAVISAYKAAGRHAQLVFVNSSWTRGHIDSLWGSGEASGASSHSASSSPRIHTVYPPCDTATLQQFPLGALRPWTAGSAAAPLPGEDSREDLVVSLAQFRPEKDHALQLRAFALFMEQMAARAAERGLPARPVTLALMGGVRDAGDAARVEELRELAASLGISGSVRFEQSPALPAVHSHLRRCTAALHSMWNEHFGIGVVEFQAAGALTVAHDSGGPQLDIVVPVKVQPTGFRATTAQQFADALLDIFTADEAGVQRLQAIRQAARRHAADRFSDEVFERRLEELLFPFVKQVHKEREQGARASKKQL